MANINEILARAAALRDETALNSISPERAGGIMYDTLLALNELWLQQGAALVISKIYASVAAMEADTAPVSDLTGKPLRPGQIVVIASSDSDNGSVYRYNGTESPSWSMVGSIGNLDPVDSLDSDSTTLPLAAHQGKVLDGKISQLGQKILDLTRKSFIQESVNHTYTKELYGTDQVTTHSGKYIDTAGAEHDISGWSWLEISVSPGMVFSVRAIAGSSLRLWVQRSGSTAIAVSEDGSSVSVKTETITIQQGVDNLCVNARTGSDADISWISIKQTISAIDWNAIYGSTKTLPAHIADIEGYEEITREYADTTKEVVFGEAWNGLVLNSYYSNADGGVGSATKLARTEKISISSFEGIEFLTNKLGYEIWTLFSWDANNNYIGYNAIAAGSITLDTIKTLRPTAALVAFNFYSSNPVDLTSQNTKDWNLLISDSGLKHRVATLESLTESIKDELDSMEKDIYGVIYGINIGTYYSNADGGVGVGNKFARTDKIALDSFDGIRFAENELDYKIWTAFAWDSSNNYLGYISVGSNYITSRTILASYPTAATMGLNLYGSNPVILTTQNTAYWSLSSPKGSIIERLSELEFRENKPNVFECKLSAGQTSVIKSPFNSQNNIVTAFKIQRGASTSVNPIFNLEYVSLVNKSTLAETIVGYCTDDITPAMYNNTYLGGNHGDSDLRVITCSSHGKTYADIGSIWSDGTHQCTIVGIVDSNKLMMLGENTLSYPLFTFNTEMFANGVTLTHVSGATHTDSITISAVTGEQWRPATTEGEIKVIADGKEILVDGEYAFSHLDICEIYDVFNPASVLAKIQAGVGTFTSNPAPNQFLDADKVVRHSIIYGFDSADKWTISTDFTAYQNINLSYFGFTQQSPLLGNIYMYIPKTLPISNGEETIDFRKIVSYDSIPQSMNITSTYWENQLLPPDRWMQYSGNIGLASGFLFDYGVGGENRKDYIQNAFYLYNASRKCYPHGIDSKISVSAGDSFSAVVWRNYLDVARVNAGGVIFTSAVKYGDSCYIYADFKAAGIYEIDIPNEFVGKKIEILEKRDNITLLSSLTNNKVLVKVTTASPMYGYIVLKF